MEFYKNYPFYPKDQKRSTVSIIQSPTGAIWNRNIEEFPGTCRFPRPGSESDGAQRLSSITDDRKLHPKKTSFMISDILSSEKLSVNTENNLTESDLVSVDDTDDEINATVSEGCSSPGMYNLYIYTYIIAAWKKFQTDSLNLICECI